MIRKVTVVFDATRVFCMSVSLLSAQPRAPTFRAGVKRIVSAAVSIELAKVELPMVRANFVDPGVSEFKREPISGRFTVGADVFQDSLQKLAAECGFDAHAALPIMCSVRALSISTRLRDQEGTSPRKFAN
jgi:hypothetical protein